MPIMPDPQPISANTPEVKPVFPAHPSPAPPPQQPKPPNPKAPLRLPLAKVLIPVLILIIIAVAFVVIRLLGSKIGETTGALMGRKTTLVYWGLWEPESVMQPIIAKYEKLHPGIT